jgi:hypothetical protein
MWKQAPVGTHRIVSGNLDPALALAIVLLPEPVDDLCHFLVGVALVHRVSLFHGSASSNEQG